jgi:hypothetical protein
MKQTPSPPINMSSGGKVVFRMLLVLMIAGGLEMLIEVSHICHARAKVVKIEQSATDGDNQATMIQ